MLFQGKVSLPKPSKVVTEIFSMISLFSLISSYALENMHSSSPATSALPFFHLLFSYHKFPHWARINVSYDPTDGGF